MHCLTPSWLKHHQASIGTLLVFMVTLVVDQVSKSWANEVLWGHSQALIPGLRLRLTHNSGVAFSLFAHENVWGTVALLLLTGMVCLGLVWVWLRCTRLSQSLALSLILAGALGNAIDRIMVGQVTDFIELYVGMWSWPIFNVADMAIFFGVVLWMRSAVQDDQVEA